MSAFAARRRATLRRGLPAILATLLGLHATVGQADTGTVVMRVPGCTHYVVSAPPDFMVMKWFGGYDPMPGEAISGPLRGFGMSTIVGRGGLQGLAWIEDFMASADAAARKMYERCAMGIR